MKRYCLSCGVYYSPNVGENGRMPKGYRICPRCTSKETKEWIRPKFKSIYDPSHHSEDWNVCLKKDKETIPPVSSASSNWPKGPEECIWLRKPAHKELEKWCI